MLQKIPVKIVLIFGAAILFVAAALVFVWQGEYILAGFSDNTSRWAWAGDDCGDADPTTFCGVGWISFNSTNSLVAYWKFDETIGITAADTVGPYDGTLVSMDFASHGVGGVPNLSGALDFDNVPPTADDYVDVPTIFDPPDEGTVALWVNTDSLGADQRIMGSVSEFEVKLMADGRIENDLFAAGTSLTSINSITPGIWYLIVATWNFNTNRQEIYINDAFDSADDTTADDDPGPAVLSIGRTTAFSTEYFNGKIDDVRIYKRVLTAVEIKDMYNEGNGLPLEDYGVHVDETTGDFSGYAWSESLGWMKLNPTTPPPAAPFFSAKLDLTPGGDDCDSDQFDVCGWARVCSAVENKATCEGSDDPFAGGWDGWVKLRAASTSPPLSPPPTDYVGYWEFDDGVGPTADDSSPSANHGTLGAGMGPDPADPDWTTSGQINGALEFDGIDDYVSVPYDTALDLTSAGTIAAWTKFDSTDAEESNFYPWLLVCEQDLPTIDTCLIPGTTDNNDGNEVDMTVVGERLYFAALLLFDSSETFWVGNTALDGTDFSGWASHPRPNGAGSGHSVSVAIESDGERLYYAAFAHNSSMGRFYTANSNLAGTSFSGWTEQVSISGKTNEYNQIDMTIVDNKMYIAAFLHVNETEYFETANVDLDGNPASFSGWMSQVAPDGAGNRDSTSVAIDSDGKRLYYAAFAHNADNANINKLEFFYLADSALNGTDFSNWVSKVAPDGTADNDQSTIDMTIVGDKMYIAALMHFDKDETFGTANINLDGTSFSGWEYEKGRRGVGGAGSNDTTSVAIDSNGRNLFYSAFTNGDDNKRFYVTSSEIGSRPIIYKEGAYELLQVGRGFVFNWAGSPKSFGSIVGPFNNVGITYDGTTMIYYVNGQEERRQTVSTSFTSNASALRIGGQPPPIPSPPADLVGHWKFDNGTGQPTVDSSIYGNDGTRGADSGAAPDDPAWTTDTINGDFALDFDGGDVVTIPTSGSLNNPSSEVTVTAWVGLNSCTGEDGTFVAKSDGSMDSGGTSLRYALWYEGDVYGADGKSCRRADLVFCVNDADNGGPNCIEVSNSIRSNWWLYWNHYAGTYDGSELRLYRDGELIGSKPLVTTITGGASSDVTIGQAFVGGSQRITGGINDVRVYDRVLSHEEIIEISREQEYSGYFDGIIDDVRLYDRGLSAAEMLDIFNLGGGGAVAYGVSWNSGTKELEGWAWGSDVVGWISFNNLNCDPDADGVTEGGANNPLYPDCPDGEVVSDYEVFVDITVPLGSPPTLENLIVTEQDYCPVSSPPIVFKWSYDDPDGDDQSGYQVQIDDELSFSAPLVDDSCVPPSGSCAVGITSQEYSAQGLSYGTEYWWRVQVWDSNGQPSGWFYPPSPPAAPSSPPGDSFTTQERYPNPSVFDWLPDPPAAEEEVQFDDQGTFSGVPWITRSWDWDFGDGSPTSSDQYPIHIYTGHHGQ